MFLRCYTSRSTCCTWTFVWWFAFPYTQKLISQIVCSCRSLVEASFSLMVFSHTDYNSSAWWLDKTRMQSEEMLFGGWLSRSSNTAIARLSCYSRRVSFKTITLLRLVIIVIILLWIILFLKINISELRLSLVSSQNINSDWVVQ